MGARGESLATPWSRPIGARSWHLLPLLRAGRARVTSQVRVAANSNAINLDDLDWECSYHPMRAYSWSKIAFDLFGLDLQRRSEAHGWGITSKISHYLPPRGGSDDPARGPTGIGRAAEGREIRLIRRLSAMGIAETPETPACLPYSPRRPPDAVGGRFYGPGLYLHMSGAPAQQKLYGPHRNLDAAQRIWRGVAP